VTDCGGAPPGQVWTRVRRVLYLAVPSAGEALLGMMVGLVNTYLVGHLGAASLAAVGLGFQWMLAAMVLFSAVGTGATALIARMVGAGDWRTANRVLAQALVVAFAAGMISMVLLVGFARPAMELMGAEGEALTQGITYLRIVSSVYAFSAVMFIGNACMRGAGDTRTPLLVMAVVNVINVVVAWALVNGVAGLPALGVAGAALGATSGRLIGGFLVVGLLLGGRAGLKLRWGGGLDPRLVRRMLKVGFPAGLEQLVFRFGMLAYVRVVSARGTVAFAAHQIALNGESLSFMPGFGFAVAATTLVGQGLGARDADRAERDAHIAFAIAAGFMSLMGVCFYFFAPAIIGLFTDESEVIALGVTPLRLIGLVQPFLAAMMVYAGALRGAGETLTPMLINGGAIWILRVPLCLLVTRVFGWGLNGVWMVMALDLTIRGTFLFTQFRMGKWKSVQV